MASDALQYDLQLKIDSVNKTLSQLEGIIKNVNPSVNLNTTKITSQINKLKVDLTSIESSKVQIQADTNVIEGKIKLVKAQISTLGNKGQAPEIDLKIDQAQAKLISLQNQLSKSKGAEIKLDIKESQINAEIAKLDSALKNGGVKAGNSLSNGVEEGASGFGSRLSRIFDSTLGNSLANAISGTTESLKGFFSSQLEGAKGLESTRTALNGILGSTEEAGVLLKDVVKFASATPFEIPELASTAKQLASAGFTSNEIIGSLQRLGDVASGTGTPLSQIAFAYGQIKTANKAYGQDLNQLQNAGIPIYSELAKTLKISSDEVKNLASKGKIGFKEVDGVLKGLTQEGGRFYQAMALQSKTLGGLLSTVSDSFGGIGRRLIGLTDEGETIAGGLFERLKVSASGFITFLSSDLSTNIFSSIGTTIGNTLGLVGSFAKEIGNIITTLTTGEITGSIFGFFEDGKLFTAIFAIRDQFFKLKGFIDSLNFAPLISSIEPIGRGINSIFDAVEKSPEAKEILKGLGEVLDGLGEVGRNLIEVALPETLQSIGNALTEIGKNQALVDSLIFSLGTIGTLVASFIIFNQVVTAVTSAIGLFAVIFNPLTLIIGVVVIALAGLYYAWNTNFLGIQTILFTAISFILTKFEEMKQGFKDLQRSVVETVVGLVLGVVNFFSQLPNRISLTLSFVKTIAITAFNGIKDTVINTISNLVRGAGDGFNNLKNSISGGIDKAVNYIKGINLFDIGKNMLEGLAKGITATAGFLGDTIKNVVNSAVSTAKNVLGIKSPSKVFAEIGNFTGQGFIKGFEKISGSIQDSVREALSFQDIANRFGSDDRDLRIEGNKDDGKDKGGGSDIYQYDNSKKEETHIYTTAYNGFEESPHDKAYDTK